MLGSRGVAGEEGGIRKERDLKVLTKIRTFPDPSEEREASLREFSETQGVWNWNNSTELFPHFSTMCGYLW